MKKKILLFSWLLSLYCLQAYTQNNAERKALKLHRLAVHIKKDGWIRDPYIYLAKDGWYYLTGTTPNLNNPQEKQYPFSRGMPEPVQPNLVGYGINIWKSKDLLQWEFVGTPFDLTKGYWAKRNPELFADKDTQNWRLWAPELHQYKNQWVLVHTSPSPVKQGANLVLTSDLKFSEPFTLPMGEEMKGKHDPSLFRNDDGTWYITWGNNMLGKFKEGFNGFAEPPIKIEPSDRRIGHEGTLVKKIGKKYVFFGTAWSTDSMRKGSYNLYYCTADSINGPYGPRQFAGRFLGHGTPFQDKEGRWWCTAFYNANVPPLSRENIQTKNLSDNAYTINPQGVTIVPLRVIIQPDGDVYIRAIDPAYSTPGPDEAQHFKK